MKSIIYLVLLLTSYGILNSILPLAKDFIPTIPTNNNVYNTQPPLLTTVNNYRIREIHGKVIKITDGDTFTMLLDNDFDVRVRLNGIDSPERKQPYSAKSKKALSDMIFNKNVRVEYLKKDGYGRVLGDVYVNEIHINSEMVRCGWAWHFKKYSTDEKLAFLETRARKNKIGLWENPNPIPPWEFRNNK